jgi:hypothetical protein
MGARHFATQNKLVQNLTQLSATPLYQDPAVNVHLSGKRMAKLIVDALQLGNYELTSDNIRVLENAETQKLMQTAQESVVGQGLVPTDPISVDQGTPDNTDVPTQG